MNDFQECIDACLKCIMECERSAAFCLEISEEAHVQAIVLSRDCADTCNLCARILARESLFTQSVCELCADVCKACASECENFSDHEPCRRCFSACKKCAEECEKVASMETL